MTLARRNLSPSLQFQLDMGSGYPETGDVFVVAKSALACHAWLADRMPSDRLFTTIAAANAAMTASSGQKCYIAEGHTESSATEIALAKAGTSFIGMGSGIIRPTLTTTGAVNAISLDAANILFQNIGFAAPGIDTVPADIDVVGAGCQIIDTFHHGSATSMNKVSFITLTATAADTVINGMRAYNDVVAMTGGGISLEGACARPTIENCILLDTIGMDLGSIFDSATATNVIIKNSIFSNAKADTVVAEFGNNSSGVASNCFFNGRHTTIQSNVTPGTSMAFHQCFGVEQAALNGLLMPAVDAE